MCNQCVRQASSFHPPVHTWSELPTGDETLRHIASFENQGVQCDGCLMAPLKGTRHQCQKCVPSFDLCDSCFGKLHTHHTFRIIQHPILYRSNQLTLARRTISLSELNQDPKWRDPVTGWTKADAKCIWEEAEQEAKQAKVDVLKRLADERQISTMAVNKIISFYQRQSEQDLQDFEWQMKMWSLRNLW